MDEPDFSDLWACRQHQAYARASRLLSAVQSRASGVSRTDASKATSMARSLIRRVAFSRSVQAPLRWSQQQPDAASWDRRVFVRAVLAAFRTRVRALTKDGKGPGPSPAAIAGLGSRDGSARPGATCPPAPASSASLCHRTPPGNPFHVGRCRSRRRGPLPGLHSNKPLFIASRTRSALSVPGSATSSALR